MGKYHIWFLPNLLADVGFFESFKPVYTIEIKNDGLFFIFDVIFGYFLFCEINVIIFLFIVIGVYCAKIDSALTPEPLKLYTRKKETNKLHSMTIKKS